MQGLGCVYQEIKETKQPVWLFFIGHRPKEYFMEKSG